MGLRLLVYGDLHLGPDDDRRAYERPDLDEIDPDAVVSLGDVIDDGTDHDHGRRGRAFFDHLNGADVPVVAVPGDRDPTNATRQLVDGLADVVLAGDRVLAGEELPGGADLDGLSLVAHGCEAFDATPTLPYTEFDPVDPRTTTNPDTIDWVADDVGDQVEEIVGAYLAGDASVDDVGDELGVHGSARERLAGYLDDVAAEYESLGSLLASADGETVLLSHRSPFNTTFDYRVDAEGLDARIHRGSIPLKMAVARTAPMLTLSGHSHRRGRDTVETVRGQRLAFNPGSPGVAVVELDRDRRRVEIETPPF